MFRSHALIFLCSLFSLNTFCQETEEVIKDFVFGITFDRNFEFVPNHKKSMKSLNVGFFVEREIVFNFSSEMFISYHYREYNGRFKFNSSNEESGGSIYSIGKINEQGFYANQRFKYKFFLGNWKPFLAVGIGVDYIESNGQLMQIYNDFVNEKAHYYDDRVKLLRASLNTGVGLDYYLGNRLFITTSLDWRYFIPQKLSRQVPTLKNEGIDNIRVKINDFYFRLGIGYNFYY